MSTWTREQLEAGFALLHQQQFESEGGRAQLPASDPDPAEPSNLTVVSELKRHVTRQMAQAAGHQQTPLLKVIRAKCLDCCGGSKAEVALCGLTDCPNWPYRFGKNPFAKRELTDDQRAELSARMRTVSAQRALAVAGQQVDPLPAIE